MRQISIRGFRFTFIGIIAIALLSGCGSAPTNNGKNSNSGFTRGEANLDIINSTGTAIYYLYLSDCSSGSWGEDQLGNDVILGRETYSFRMTPGCWDLRAESAEGEEAEHYGVEMDDGDSSAWTIRDWASSSDKK